MMMGGLFLFLFENEVVVRANLPEGGLETVHATDETEEVWDGGSGAEEEWDRGGITAEFGLEHTSGDCILGAGEQEVEEGVFDVVVAVGT